MKHIKIIFLTFLSAISFAQNSFNSDSFAVARGDIETAIYEKDSTANALVIFESGNSEIEFENFNLVFDFKQKLKILNRQGFDEATIEIDLYNNKKRKEKIRDITATTYNIENGEITKTKLNPINIYKERSNDNITTIKFTFPNLKPGSVITYAYTIETPFVYKYKTWRFQSNIPKLFSEYHTSYPANYDYNVKLVGTKKLDSIASKIKKNCVSRLNGASADCTVSNYVMKDIPAFVEEDFMTAKSNYLSALEYELKTIKGFDGYVDNITKSWDTVDKELKTSTYLGRELNKKGAIKDLLSNAIITKTNNLEKATAIYEYVQDHFKWNGKYQIFKNVSVRNVVKNKTGKVSEINLLLYNLLKSQEIEVYPVLMSTRKNGFPTQVYPVISDFNYVLLQAIIDGETYLLDATDPFLCFGQIPFKCLNSMGRLLDFKTGSRWIPIAPKKPSSEVYRTSFVLDAENVISGSFSSIKKGYAALRSKKAYFNNPGSHLDTYLERYPEIEISNDSVVTKKKIDSRFVESFDVKLQPDVIDGIVYFNPFLFNAFNENPFKLQERSYPINFGYKKTYVYAFKMTIDDTFKIIEIPKSEAYQLGNNGGRLIYNVTQNKQDVLIYLKYTTEKTIYNPSDYPNLKELMNKLLTIQKNSLIVVKKK